MTSSFADHFDHVDSLDGDGWYPDSTTSYPLTQTKFLLKNHGRRRMVIPHFDDKTSFLCWIDPHCAGPPPDSCPEQAEPLVEKQLGDAWMGSGGSLDSLGAFP